MSALDNLVDIDIASLFNIPDWSNIHHADHDHLRVMDIDQKTLLTWRSFLLYINAKNSWQYMVVQIGTISFSFMVVFVSTWALLELVQFINPI